MVTNTFHDGGDMELKVTKNWWNNGSSAEISDRPTAIQVKIERMASNATGWMPYPDEANCTYTMTPSSSGTWELSLPNVPRQGKDDKGNLVTYIYRVTEVGYTANGQTHEIKENQFATTTAGIMRLHTVIPLTLQSQIVAIRFLLQTPIIRLKRRRSFHRRFGQKTESIWRIVLMQCVCSCNNDHRMRMAYGILGMR